MINLLSPNQQMLYSIKSIIINKSESRPCKPSLAPECQYTDFRSSDSFQGEEAKIGIISLVRSNNTGKVGFLSSRNRTNVLLRSALMPLSCQLNVANVHSRAQHGFYIIGNTNIAERVPM